MVKFESGFFLDKIPYVKFGQGPKKVVLFQGSIALILKIGVSLKGEVKDMAKYLTPDYTCYIFGYDRNLPQNITMEQIASDLATIIKDIGKAIVVGKSYGGQIAITFAARYPELTERLILLSSGWKLSVTGFEFGKNLMLALGSGDFKAASKELGNLFVGRIYRVLIPFATLLLKSLKRNEMYPSSTLINAYMDMVNQTKEREKYLAQIRVPTFIVGGTRDRVFSKEIYEETEKKILNAKLILFEGAGHMLETVNKKELSAKIQACFM